MSTLVILADNIRYLRMQIPDLTQNKLAEKLFITRDSYAKYETGKASPPLDVLLAISRYFHVSTDLLLTVDLRKYKLEEMLKLPDNRILFPIKTDSLGENKIEVVPYKASMGYLVGYSDPAYIESLQTISLPFLRNGKYRAFPAEGSSMPPYKDGTFIVGEYVENLKDLKSGKSYIFVTRDGITYKRYSTQKMNKVEVRADNPLNKPFEIFKENILEIWQFRCSISLEEFDVIQAETTLAVNNNTIMEMLISLKGELATLRH